MVVECCLFGGCTHINIWLAFCMLACMDQRKPYIEVGSLLWQPLHYVAVVEPLFAVWLVHDIASGVLFQPQWIHKGDLCVVNFHIYLVRLCMG